jgi:hypothetical protein
MEERNSFSSLIQSLNFRSSRLCLQLIEDDLVKFVAKAKSVEVKKGKEIQMEFPTMTSGYRYLIHVTSLRFGLKSASNGWGHDRSTTVTFSSTTSVPKLQFRDFQPHYEDPLSPSEMNFLSTHIKEQSEIPFVVPVQVETIIEKRPLDTSMEQALPQKIQKETK